MPPTPSKEDQILSALSQIIDLLKEIARSLADQQN